MSADPLIVGVAGKCCSGKDLVTDHLVEHGWRVIDVDRIGHEALVARRDEIVASFGDEILAEDGTIDRAKLGAVVFAGRDRLVRLERIVHPWMRARVREETESFRAVQGGDKQDRDVPRGLVINAALLFYMALDSLCDLVVLVEAPLWVRVSRARRRDGFSWRRIIARLRAQRSINAQARSSDADVIRVRNGKRPADVYARLASIPGLGIGEATSYGAK